MPYIKLEDRVKYDNAVDELAIELLTTKNLSGDLNYIISSILALVIKERGMSYGTASTLVSALECAKLEFVRRVLDPYEDKKITDNGDVYEDLG